MHVSLWDSLVLCEKEVMRTQGSTTTWKDVNSIILRPLGLTNLGDDVDEIAAKAAEHQ